MNLKRPSPAMVVALIALVMSTTGGALAAVNYARNAGKVDGYDAVQAKSSNDKAAGRLVATYPGGEEKGKLPFRFLSGVASESDLTALADAAALGKNGAQTIAVSDNAPTTEVNLIDLGVGNLQVSCVDQADTVGVEDPGTLIAVSNHSPAAFNIARRLGTGNPFIRALEPNTAETFVVGVRNTFAIQLQAAPATTVLIEGAAEQRGEGTADGSCVVWATALFVD
jgi:hypothetical protein